MEIFMINYLCKNFLNCSVFERRYGPSTLSATPRQSSTCTYKLNIKTFKMAVPRRSPQGEDWKFS